MRMDRNVQRESTEFARKLGFQLLHVAHVLGLIHHIARRQALLHLDEAGVRRTVDQLAHLVVDLRNRKVHILVAVADADHVVLIQLAFQCELVHTLLEACNGADPETVVVRALWVHDIFLVLVKQITLRVGAVESAVQLLQIVCVGPSVQRHAVARNHIGHVFGPAHAPFDLQRIDARKVVRRLDGVQVLGGKDVALAQGLAGIQVNEVVQLAA